MSLDISQQFEKINYQGWLSSAMSSLKITDEVEFEQKMNFRSCDGLELKAFYSDEKKEFQLDSFPSQTKLMLVPIEISNFYAELEQCQFNIKELKSKIKEADSLLIDTSFVHNAGGSIIQEIVFGLSLVKLAQEEFDYSGKFIFKVSLDSQVFSQVAKLRALRFMLESFQVNFKLSDFEILSESSLREQTLFDPWANMLRNTTSAAASFIGGTDYFIPCPFDKIATYLLDYKGSELGKRQAKNIFHILEEESHLNFVSDPSKGSYALEDLTDQILHLSFEKFKQLEKEGGILKNKKKFSHEVELIAHERRERIKHIKPKIVGINYYSHTEENLQSLYQTDSFRLIDEGLFPLRRLSDDFEKLRLMFQNKDLQIKILTYGDKAKLSQRIMFCQNYFEVLGHAVTCHSLSNDFNGDKIDGVILCAQDDDYPQMLEEISLNFKCPCFLAGNKFKREGFINIFNGQNVLKTLKKAFLKEEK